MLHIIIIMTLGLISPGPDFVIVIRNSLSSSRTYGIWTAFGVALGTLVHITYIWLGMEFLIQKNIWLFSILKYLGAGYLIYLGYKSFTNTARISISHEVRKNASISQAITSGFLTNALNPKAMLFFIGLFTVAIESNSNTNMMLLYVVIIFMQTFVWFTVVAIVFSNHLLKSRFNSVQSVVDKTIGAIFIALGTKLMFSKL